MAFKKAVKEQAKLRLALCGLAGAGKSFSAQAIADGLAKLIRTFGGPGRVAVIDSERGSASLYADRFEFDVCELEDTFSPLAYVERMKEAAREGYDIVIVDSLSHAWSGKGGALDQKDQAAARGGNSWTAWRDVSPKHNALVDALLNYPGHVIATMRVKMEHVQEVENGKTVIKKVGLAAVQREGMDYEFTLVGDIDHSHTLKISKSRLHGVVDVGDQIEKPGAEFAGRIFNWLMDGAKPQPRPVPAPVVVADPKVTAAVSEPAMSAALGSAFAAYLAGIDHAPDQATLDRMAGGPGKPTKGSPEAALAKEHYVQRQKTFAEKAA